MKQDKTRLVYICLNPLHSKMTKIFFIGKHTKKDDVSFFLWEKESDDLAYTRIKGLSDRVQGYNSISSNFLKDSYSW